MARREEFEDDEEFEGEEDWKNAGKQQYTVTMECGGIYNVEITTDIFAPKSLSKARKVLADTLRTMVDVIPHKELLAKERSYYEEVPQYAVDADGNMVRVNPGDLLTQRTSIKRKEK